MLLLGDAGQAETYTWDPVPDTTQPGGEGDWNTTNAYWKTGTAGTPSFFPVLGADNDIQLIGDASLLHLIGSAAFNDLYSGPSNGKVNAVVNDFAALISDGAVPSRIEIADTTTLKISTRFFGSVPIGKFGAGTLTLDNTANNLTGGFLVNAGTLSVSDRSAFNALRSNPVDLASGTLLSASTGLSLRVGALTGSGSVVIGSMSLHINNFNEVQIGPDTVDSYYRPGPVFSGSATAGGMTISAAGGRRVFLPGGGGFSNQTFTGLLENLTGNLVVNSGAAFTLFSNAGVRGGAIGATGLILRGGALLIDSSKGSGGTAYGRVSNTINANIQSGSIVFIGGGLPIDESLGPLRISSGGSTISVVQPGSALAKLSFGLVTRDGTARSTVDFRSIGGTLGSPAGPQIYAGFTPGTLDPWATVNGTDYASYQSSYGVMTASVTTLPASISGPGGASYYSISQSAAFNSASTFAARGLRILPGAENQSLTISGSGSISTGGILLAGSRDYSITSSGTGGLTATTPRYFGVMEPEATLRISAPVRGAGYDVVKFGPGALELSGDNTGLGISPTNLVVNAGVLRGTISGPAASIPIASTGILLRGGVLEIKNGAGASGASADFRSPVGVGMGKVNWATDTTFDEGGGGFSAHGSDATVNLGGSVPAASIAWNSSFFVHNGHALLFGSRSSDARLTFENPISLDDGAGGNPYFAREIRVHGNADPAVRTDAARLSGVISGGLNADLLKTGDGTLELTASNTFTGNVLVQEGVLQLGANGGAGAGSSAILVSTSKVIVRASLDYIDGKVVATNRATLRLGGDPASSTRISDSATIVMEGGIIETNGLSETFGILIVSQTDAILDLGNGSGLIQFASAADQSWSGSLRIVNYNGDSSGSGLDHVFFSSSFGGLRPDQLARISFFGDYGETYLGTARQLNSGEIVPIPETSPALAVLFGVAVLGTRRHRRR